MEKKTQDKTNEIKDVQPIRDLQKIEDMKWALRRQPWRNKEVPSWESERNYMMFSLGINTGLRIGDLLKIKIKDVKGKKVFIVKEGKTDKPRKVYINGMYDELNAYIKLLEGTEWLFPSRQGDKAISTVQAWRILQKAADYAGVESVGTHTLRKTFGYWFYKQTKDVAKLQLILNHAHPRITLTYIGITEEEIENSLENFHL